MLSLSALALESRRWVSPVAPDYVSKPQDEAMMTRDCVEVYGARENNLKEVDVSIPRNALVVFAGVWAFL